MRNSFDVIVDSKAVAKRCFVLFVVGASASLGTVVLLIQALPRGCLSLSSAVRATRSFPEFTLPRVITNDRTNCPWKPKKRPTECPTKRPTRNMKEYCNTVKLRENDKPIMASRSASPAPKHFQWLSGELSDFVPTIF